MILASFVRLFRDYIRRRTALAEIARLDDRTLLVAGTSGTTADVRRYSSIATLGPDGILHGRVHERGTLRVTRVPVGVQSVSETTNGLLGVLLRALVL